MMKTKTVAFLIFITILSVTSSENSSSQTAAHTLLMETSKGKIKFILYEQTPMHIDNFIQLVNDGTYNGVLFHRVIKDFMIQTGDPDSKNAAKGALVGSGGPAHRVPAEFHPDLYHKNGALAAARQGDQTNPNRESNGSQFYIVKGEVFTDEQLDQMENSGAHIKFTAEQRMVYKAVGGTPHLDYGYTVFGEVIEGFEVIDAIAAEPTDERDRPIEDVKIIKIIILK
jgi:cyclophilin family peptidyl-prolyl cis-trans isomerase